MVNDGGGRAWLMTRGSGRGAGEREPRAQLTLSGMDTLPGYSGRQIPRFSMIPKTCALGAAKILRPEKSLRHKNGTGEAIYMLNHEIS
jgi:hypothetical protein